MACLAPTPSPGWFGPVFDVPSAAAAGSPLPSRGSARTTSGNRAATVDASSDSEEPPVPDDARSRLESACFAREAPDPEDPESESSEYESEFESGGLEARHSRVASHHPGASPRQPGSRAGRPATVISGAAVAPRDHAGTRRRTDTFFFVAAPPTPEPSPEEDETAEDEPAESEPERTTSTRRTAA